MIFIDKTLFRIKFLHIFTATSLMVAIFCLIFAENRRKKGRGREVRINK
jgi:hypothetical protein